MSYLPVTAVASWRARPRALFVLGAGAALAVGGIALHNPVALLGAVPLVLAPLIALGARPSGAAAADLAWDAEGIGPVVELVGTVTGPFGSAVGGLAVVPPSIPGATAGPPQYDRAPDRLGFRLPLTLGEPLITLLAPPRVVWRDPWDLVEETLPGRRPPLPVERYPPELHRLRTLRLDRTTQLPGEARSRRIGSTGEFFGIRDAAPGEPPRRINWRASARVGRLLANDYEMDRTGDMLLMLDVRPTTLGRAADERLLGVARAGLFGIAESLLRGKVRVGYAAFGEFVDAVPLGAGRTHRIRIERAVLASRRAEVAGPPDRCTFGLRRYFRPGLTTMLVSAWAGDPAFELLPYLARGGFPAVLISPSPYGLGRPPATATISEEEAILRRLELAERRAQLASLWQHGPVVDWADHWSLDPLVRFLERPTRQRVT